MANSAVEKTISTQELKEKLLDVLHNDFQTTPEDASDQQVYEALSKIVVGILKAKRRKFTVKTQSEGKKKVYYLSMEFLMGRSLKTSLYNLEMQKQATKVLKDMGISINGIYECEPDAGLGNGGLGRLAACYLDALAADGYHAILSAMNTVSSSRSWRTAGRPSFLTTGSQAALYGSFLFRQRLSRFVLTASLRNTGTISITA